MTLQAKARTRENVWYPWKTLELQNDGVRDTTPKYGNLTSWIFQAEGPGEMSVQDEIFDLLLKQIITSSYKRHPPCTWRKGVSWSPRTSDWPRGIQTHRAFLRLPQFTPLSSYPFCPLSRLPTTSPTSSKLVQKRSGGIISLGLHFSMEALMSHQTYSKYMCCFSV